MKLPNMTLNELIVELQKIQKTHGHGEVLVLTSGGMESFRTVIVNDIIGKKTPEIVMASEGGMLDLILRLDNSEKCSAN